MNLVFKRKRRVAAYPYHIYLSEKHVIEVKKGGQHIGIYLITRTNRRRGVVLPLSAWIALQDFAGIVNLAIEYAKGTVFVDADGDGGSELVSYGGGIGCSTSPGQYTQCIDQPNGYFTGNNGCCHGAAIVQGYYPSAYFNNKNGECQLHCPPGGGGAGGGAAGVAENTITTEVRDIATAGTDEGGGGAAGQEICRQDSVNYRTGSTAGWGGFECGEDYTLSNINRHILSNSYSGCHTDLKQSDPICGHGSDVLSQAAEEFDIILRELCST